MRVGSMIEFEDGELTREEEREIRESNTHSNPKFFMLQRIRRPTYGERPHDLTYRCRCNKRVCQCGGAVAAVHRGQLSDVASKFRGWGKRWRYRDERSRGAIIPEADRPQQLRALRGYQTGSIDRMAKRGQGILRAPTGSGKTSVLIGLAVHIEVPTLVVLPNDALMKQWAERVREEAGIEPGIIKGPMRTLRPITLGSHKTLVTRGIDEEMNAYFGAVMVDEVHTSAASTYVDVISSMRAFYRFGVSDDERRKDGKEYIVHAVVGPVLVELDREALVRDGHVLEVEFRVYPTDFEAPWFGIPTEEEEADKSVDRELNTGRLHTEMAIDATRNARALGIAFDAVQEGRTVFVLAHQREHCRALMSGLVASGIPTGLLMGADTAADRSEFDRTLEDIRQRRLRVAVGTYQAIGTGIDVPGLDDVVCVTPIASNRMFCRQVRGRACRPSPGKRPRFHYLWDEQVFGDRPVRQLTQINPVVRLEADVPATPRGGLFPDADWGIDARAWLRERRRRGL